MEARVVDEIWLTDTAIWIRTADGKEACEKFANYPRLKFATSEQRARFTVNKFGVRWEELDEDLSFEGFFSEKKTVPLYNLFMAHPELNAAAVARRLGMSQSLFAQYVSGTKKPSEKRLREIIETIRAIGRELSDISA